MKTTTHEERVLAAQQKVAKAQKQLALLKEKDRKAQDRTKILAGVLMQAVTKNSGKEFWDFLVPFTKEFFTKRPEDAKAVLAFLENQALTK